MLKDDESGQKLAELLLKINAIQLNVKEPFTWASGIKSPIYCDNRLILSYPEIRTFVRQCFEEVIVGKYSPPDVIVGVATGAIAHGVLVAQDMGLPFAYVRSAAKSHGRKQQVEGKIEKDNKVLIIEDLVSTGGSSLKVVDILKKEKVQVMGMVAIFTYGLPVSQKNFEKSGIELTTLTNFETLLDVAAENQYIKKSDIALIRKWSQDPEGWKPR